MFHVENSRIYQPSSLSDRALLKNPYSMVILETIANVPTTEYTRGYAVRLFFKRVIIFVKKIRKSLYGVKTYPQVLVKNNLKEVNNFFFQK